ncbi:MAG: NTP transferase domain-containing protein [Ilumatobacteraceae bacterium]
MTAGAVLCGGASRRMGTDKAFVEVDGIAMAERVATALEAAGCVPVVFVGGDSALLARFGRPVHEDRWPGEGPAGGVLTALLELDDDVVVAACDLALLSERSVLRLVHEAARAPAADVVVASTDRLQPGLALWRRAARPQVDAQWTAGTRALHRLVEALTSVTVRVDPAELRNVNTTADLTDAERSAGYIDHVAVSEIDIDEFAQRLDQGARVIDVREPDEYVDGHVPGAILIPLATVPDHLDEFRGDGPTYVICKSGGRSRRACEFVAAQGLEGVETINVEGGTGAWIASGREAVRGDQPS